MALGLIKLTKRQRKCLSIIFVALNLIQIVLGCAMTGTSIYIYITVAPVLFSERAEINFVFVVTGIYGTHVVFHWLCGIKICQKCYTQAHKKSTRGLLLLWTCAGTNTVINLAIIAGMSRRISKHIVKSMKNSLQNGMRTYLTDALWKYHMDKIQATQQCCGIKSFDDWHKIEWITKYHINTKSALVHRFQTEPGNFKLPITPWSCCKIDFPMECFHDPIQQVMFVHLWFDDPTVVTNSLNTRGCLDILKKPVSAGLYTFVALSILILILHIVIFLLSRILYTSCRNAILLNDPDGIAPGWIFGRGDCGYSRGKTLYEIMGTVPETELDKTGIMEEELEKMERK